MSAERKLMVFKDFLMLNFKSELSTTTCVYSNLDWSVSEYEFLRKDPFDSYLSDVPERGSVNYRKSTRGNGDSSGSRGDKGE